MGLDGQVSPSSKLDPTIPYAISKYASELYIRAHRNQLETFREYTILRFFGAYGPYEPLRKISTKLVQLAKNPRENRFTVFGDGKNYIDFMYIDDAIEGLTRVISSRKTNLTIDFCSGSHQTINQLVKKVGKIFNKEIQIEHKGSSPEYIRFYASSRSVLREFGFKPRTSLRDGFRKFADWLNKGS